MAMKLSGLSASFADDTCEALKEYPGTAGNTTLDYVLPCNDLATGDRAMFKLRQQVYNYIVQVSI
jgi:hypothetical protein